MKPFIHLISGLDVAVEPDPSGGFFAVVPALPGCGSQGESIYETLENLNDAIMTVLDVLGDDDPDRLEALCGGMTVCGTIEEADTTAPLVSSGIRVEAENAA